MYNLGKKIHRVKINNRHKDFELYQFFIHNVLFPHSHYKYCLQDVSTDFGLEGIIKRSCQKYAIFTKILNYTKPSSIFPLYMLFTYYPNYLPLSWLKFMSLPTVNSHVFHLPYSNSINLISQSNLNYKKMFKFQYYQLFPHVI